MAAVDIVLVFMAIPCVIDQLQATASECCYCCVLLLAERASAELALHIGAV
jgi:hypothetical protein